MKTKYLFLIFLISGLTSGSLQAQENSDLSVFLKPTEFIDSDNPEIISKAQELTKDCNTDMERVKSIFEFVRDSYTTEEIETRVASEILKQGGNSCYKRAVLFAALARAVGIPSRLQYQYFLIKNYNLNGDVKDRLFTHGIVGLYVDGNWYLYEPVGNNAKWKVWVQKTELEKDMTVQFKPHQDCLFPSTEKVILKTFPIYFSDYSIDRYSFMMKIALGEIGFDFNE